jgi:hypothetical protein
MVFVVFFLFSLTTLASLSTNIWLSRWTDHAKKETLSINETSSSSSIDKIRGLTIYSILGCCQGNKYNLFLLLKIIFSDKMNQNKTL